MMPMHTFNKVQIIKITHGHSESMQDAVVTEIPFTMWLNGSVLATIICTPTHHRELAAGFLLSEGEQGFACRPSVRVVLFRCRRRSLVSMP